MFVKLNSSPESTEFPTAQEDNLIRHAARTRPMQSCPNARKSNDLKSNIQECNKTLLFLPPTRIGFGFPASAGKSDYPRLAPKIRYHTKLENLIFNQRAAPSLS
jgi:hypothetical protein